MITLTLSSDELSQIQQMMKEYARDWKILRRLRCILLRSEKKDLWEIRGILQVSDDAIASWCKLYQEWWLNALCLLHYEGRRFSKLTPHQALIEELVDTQIHNTYAELLHAVEEKIGSPLGVKWAWFVKFCKKNSILLQRNVEWSQENVQRKKSKNQWLSFWMPS